MYEEEAERQIVEYLRKLELNNYTVDGYKKGQYNFHSDIRQQNQKLKLFVYFGKNGLKTIIQGEVHPEFSKSVYNLLGITSNFKDVNEDEQLEPEHYIGTDESGKGDYFGPLVIAGVVVTTDSVKKLKLAGVKDSKELNDTQITLTYQKIIEIVKDKFEVITISPATYNSLHSRMKNVNRILGWAHAKIIENILEKNDVSEAISDKFGNEDLILNSLQSKGKKIKLAQYTKAERFLGVAAASIVARKNFIDWFTKKSKSYDFNLPKGASSEVIKAGKLLLQKFGEDELNQVAKIHFKTTKQIIN